MDIELAKIYVGLRSGGPDNQRTRVKKIQEGIAEDLFLRLDLARHSSTGFDWGSDCAGSAQLALAILADASGTDDLAVLYHQAFLDQIIVELGNDEWWIRSDDVSKWLAEAWQPPHKYYRFVVEYTSNKPDQVDSMIQAAIKRHIPLFYNRWKVSGRQLAELKIELRRCRQNSSYFERWRLCIDIGTSDPDWMRYEIDKALCLHVNISELDLVVAEGWIVLEPDCQSDNRGASDDAQ